MRVFIAVLVLIFSLQSFTKADDISDFEIEGMSIGDSLLDYMSAKKIKVALSDPITFYYKNNTFAVINYLNSSEMYNDISITVKPDDKKYNIYAVEGRLFFPNNIDGCITKRDQIVKEILSDFKNHKFSNYEGKHGYDKSGKSLVYAKELKFSDNAVLTIYCMDWSKEISETDKFKDTLKVMAVSAELRNWVNKNAYN